MPSERIIEAAEEYNRFARRLNAPGRCDPTLGFERRELVQVAALWRELAADRAMPSRKDINARSLKPFLPNVAIVDVGKARKYRVRLMGTAIARILGDHTGKFLDEAVISPFRERWAAALDAGLAAGCPIRVSGQLDYQEQDYLAMELLIAPIGSSGRDAEALLVVGYVNVSARKVFEPLVRDALAGKYGEPPDLPARSGRSA